MSLLFIEGFDHYGGSGTNLQNGAKWNAYNNRAGLNGSTPRTGPYAVALYGDDNLTKILSPAGDVFIAGFAIRNSALGTGGINIIQFQEGGTVHIAVTIDASGFLVVKRDTTTLATATTHPIVANSWYYIEVKVVIHDTTGSVTVHVDTETPTFSGSLTGIDTKNGGTGNVDRVVFNGHYSYPYCLFDDIYICDDAGSTNNNFLGICVVETLLPQTGAGTHQDFTPSSGTDHGAMVDEASVDDDTTYNSSLTVGHQDSYNYPSLALTGSILGIQTALYTKKSDAGARTVAPLVRTASTTTPGAAVSPTTSYKYYSQLWESKPAGGAWTESDINALEVGMKIVS